MELIIDLRMSDEKIFLVIGLLFCFCQSRIETIIVSNVSEYDYGTQAYYLKILTHSGFNVVDFYCVDFYFVDSIGKYKKGDTLLISSLKLKYK